MPQEDAKIKDFLDMSDGSLDCQRKEGRRKVSADRNYSVEVVSPICQYGDIETVQELIRRLREAGAFVNSSCGIHIHINTAPFDAPHLRNLVNIMHPSRPKRQREGFVPSVGKRLSAPRIRQLSPRSKKEQDKGGWSQAPSRRPLRPAVLGVFRTST